MAGLPELRLRIEEQVQDTREVAQHQKRSVSCPKAAGCWGCCRGEVVLHDGEMQHILPLVDDAAWERILDSGRAIQRESCTVICPLLDPVTKACTVYAERPLACRAYVVVTPKEFCYPGVVGQKLIATPVETVQLLAEVTQRRHSRVLSRELLELACERRATYLEEAK